MLATVVSVRVTTQFLPFALLPPHHVQPLSLPVADIWVIRTPMFIINTAVLLTIHKYLSPALGGSHKKNIYFVA